MLAGGTVEWIVGSILVKSFVVFGLGFAAEQSCEQAGPCIAGLIVVASVIVAVMSSLKVFFRLLSRCTS